MSDFMKGGCYSLALWLHRKTGLTIYGLFDGDQMHHAMVGDGTTFYDARGRVSLATVRHFRGRLGAGTEIRATTPEDCEDYIELIKAIHGLTFSNGKIASFVRSNEDLVELISS